MEKEINALVSMGAIKRMKEADFDLTQIEVLPGMGVFTKKPDGEGSFFYKTRGSFAATSRRKQAWRFLQLDVTQ
jgi:hypothetical protein